MGRLDGPKGQDELNGAVNQLRSYIRAHIDQASIKPKTVLGVVTDGNHWLLLGLNRINEFHTITEWAFLTDDPRLICQRMWLLAKPALAQPTSALVEFLARRTLAEILKDNAKWLTKKVNERLPDGAVSQDLIAKWLRDALSDPTFPPRLVSGEPPPPGKVGPEPDPDLEPEPGGETSWPVSRRQVALESVASTTPDAVPGDESPEKTKTGTSIDDKNEIAGPMGDLYQELRVFLLALGNDVIEKPTKLYIAYRRIRSFAEVKVQKSQLLVFLRIDPRSVTLEEGFSRDVSEIGHHGIGNLELTVKTKADLKNTETLLMRSYDEASGRRES
jgi:predicted transport protein